MKRSRTRGSSGATAAVHRRNPLRVFWTCNARRAPLTPALSREGRGSRVAECVEAGGERGGLTLLEVVLALAIFVGTMAAILQIVNNGMRGAVRARLQTQAVVRCEAKIGELVAGAEPMQAVDSMPFADDPTWVWSATVNSGSTQGLYLVGVTVQRVSTGPGGNVTFTAQRMMRDPQLFYDAFEAEQEAEAASASNQTSSKATQGTTSQGNTTSASGSGR